MKAYEVIKKENEGKEYTCRGKICKVAYDEGFGAYLLADDEPLHVGEWLFKAEFEEVQERSSWDRGIVFDDIYYYVNTDGVVSSYTYYEDSSDCDLQNNANVFLSEVKANEVSKEQLLYRLMKRFRDENDEYIDWMNEVKTAYFILRSVEKNSFMVGSWSSIRDLHTIYFTTEELAQRCLNEIVLPFTNKNKN